MFKLLFVLLVFLVLKLVFALEQLTEDRWDLDANFDSMDNDTTLQERIIGGNNIGENESYNYQISLQYLKNGKHRHFCGGSIISPSHILTAAHCVSGQDAKKFKILAGISNLDATDGSSSQVQTIDVHQRYRRLQGNDIAILTIKPPLVLDGQRMDKISVDYIEGVEVGEDEDTILTGWGSTTTRTSPTFAKILQKLNYETISNEKCKKTMTKLTETEICAIATRGTGACAGDSGGPLVMRNNVSGEVKQVGIVSYGPYRCGANGVDVYTRISKFDKWIKERIAEENCNTLFPIML